MGDKLCLWASLVPNLWARLDSNLCTGLRAILMISLADPNEDSFRENLDDRLWDRHKEQQRES